MRMRLDYITLDIRGDEIRLEINLDKKRWD